MQDLHMFTALTPHQLERCYPVMKELRPELTLESFLQIHEIAHRHDGYEIVAIEDKAGNILAVMGYRFLHDYVHGKHLYIDDLVSTESARSQGLGAKLLKRAEEIAQLNHCTGLRLCTGIENERGKKFYEKNNWIFRSVVYKKKF